MRRAIQRLVQDPLALKLLKGEFVEGDRVIVDAAPGDAELQFRKSEPAREQEEVLQQ
jgi:ATP-dependent Clp protease ATP-binding subunit ClpB